MARGTKIGGAGSLDVAAINRTRSVVAALGACPERSRRERQLFSDSSDGRRPPLQMTASLIWARLLDCNGAGLRMVTLVQRLPLSQLIGVWCWRRKINLPQRRRRPRSLETSRTRSLAIYRLSVRASSEPHFLPFISCGGDFVAALNERRIHKLFGGHRPPLQQNWRYLIVPNSPCC